MARARCLKANPQGCEKSGAIIYPLCRSGFSAVGSNICSPKCPSGYKDIGVSCQKVTYDRGAGVTPPSIGGTCTVDYSPHFSDGSARRYDQMTWLAQHNAFANSDDHWIHVMSTFSIDKQLKGGVRALALDAHSHDGSVMMCHGDRAPDPCTGAAGSNYALPRKTLGDELSLVKTFLDQNPSQIVTVFLESYIDDAARIRAEIDAAGLTGYVFDPADDPDWKISSQGWPTVDWMVQQNRRFVIFTDSSKDEDNQVGAAYVWRYTVENTYDLGNTGQNLDCANRSESGELSTKEKMFVMDHFRSLPNLVAAQQDNQKDGIMNRFKNKCLPTTKRPPSFLFVDFYHHPYCGAADAVNELNRLWESYKQ